MSEKFIEHVVKYDAAGAGSTVGSIVQNEEGGYLVRRHDCPIDRGPFEKITTARKIARRECGEEITFNDDDK